MRLAAVFIATLLFAGAANAESGDAPFVFRGHAIGEPIGKGFAACARDAKADETGLVQCDAVEPKDRWGVADVPRLGDVDVEWLRYIFLDGKLVGIDVPFRNEKGAYDDVRDMATVRYGAPRQIVPGTDTVIAWTFMEGRLLLAHLGNAAHLSFIADKARVILARRHAAAIAKRAKRAF
jgi:hypothetical protein